MSTSPGATPVTTPAFVTVAIAVFDDCHVAWLVTFWVTPFDIVAVAVNCAVSPTLGAAPVTAICVTVAAGVVGVLLLLLLQATTVVMIAAPIAIRRLERERRRISWFMITIA